MAQAAPLSVRIGRATVDAANTRAVADAIATANASQRMDGLPDALNPWLIDPAKAQAMLAAVAALPATARKGLGSHAILLATPGLPVMVSSPSTPASFSKLTGITATTRHGDAAEVRLAMPLDCDLARSTVVAAGTAVGVASADIASLEKTRRTATGDALTKVLDERGAAGRRRFALAITWHENAIADSACRPADPQAKAQLTAAAKARKDYAVSTGGLN